MGDYNKDDKGNDKKKKAESFIGGQKSGLAVQDRDEEDDDLEKIVNRAKAE